MIRWQSKVRPNIKPSEERESDICSVEKCYKWSRKMISRVGRDKTEGCEKSRLTTTGQHFQKRFFSLASKAWRKVENANERNTTTFQNDHRIV